MDEFAGKILTISRVVEPELDLTVVDADPDDDKILECAVAGDVDCLVSGDSHLVDLDTYGSIDVYSPAKFLQRVEQ